MSEHITSEPIFKPVFGDDWEKLPPVFRKHYANRPYSNDVVTVQGKMDISYSRFARLMMPFFKMLGTLVPYQGNNIDVTVKFKSDTDSAKFQYDREFRFSGKEPYYFRSYMVQIKDDIVVEFMRFGIGWRTRFTSEGNKVILNHAGYVWKLFGFIIPLPISLIIGKGYAEEEALSENEFKMKMEINHPLFGKVFEYSGEFKCL